ncbi:pyridoxal phosphate-dependent aminotransferase [Antribacter sp. KLBMP9083]|uniref:Pyridoxal phosphate-dependent aminotransferase n=1 Tax=Antribacter soli TaxID=2910976 RepID=A0AA41U613_9MICO|nr:pyridoxal phosphate-dependent aminotransferase [Antribacter soli]MCF4119820.1 pyridoxal phosphate-dependent aminotransferase [Antribacter soli]
MSTLRWQAAARATGLLAPDGTVAATIFAEMSALAARTGAINLGQGFPDVDGPEYIKEAAIAAIREGRNQYPPGDGIPELRHAVADHQKRHYGLDVDPDTEVLVTTGATEALAATILALVSPGDEVITLEPFYDAHAACIAMAGGTHVTVPLVAAGPENPEGSFRLDVAALRAAASPRTRLILLNTPHNPTGTVLDRAELEAIAQVARERDALVLTDEVYEHLVFDGAVHVPIATLPGMAERTLTVSSSGKTFSFTGWKIGWVHGPADLVTAVRTIKQFLTYVSGAPFQPAIARALADDDAPRALAASLAFRRDLLVEGLEKAGFGVSIPQGTYFVVADGGPLGFPDGVDLCRRLPELAGVVAVPVTAFCTPGSPTAEALRSRIRLTFVKRDEVLREASARLAGLTP